MRLKTTSIILGILLMQMGSASSSDGNITCEGVVVAVQKAKDEVRMSDPQSMGDMVEIWMLKIDKWTGPESQNFVMVEYSHRDPIIADSELNRTSWRFQLLRPPPKDSNRCAGWWPDGRSFVPTRIGRKLKLPREDTLRCFVMVARPIPIAPKLQ